MREHLINEARQYKPDEFELFCAELGWEDWMADYTSAAEGEVCSERELEVINSILKECFNEAQEMKRTC